MLHYIIPSSPPPPPLQEGVRWDVACPHGMSEWIPGLCGELAASRYGEEGGP